KTTSTTAIYTLSLHDALPISGAGDHGAGNAKGNDLDRRDHGAALDACPVGEGSEGDGGFDGVEGVDRRPVHAQDTRRSSEKIDRSEEHTSELQSRENLVCRLL